LVLFVGSGCAALINEVVWLQLLQLTLGSTAVAMGVVLATFMGGLCLGSLLLPRVVSPRHHPLRVFAMLELGIGVLGLAVLFGMPEVDRLYSQLAGSGLTARLLGAGVAALCLLPPTLLMGATFPALARWVESTREGAARLGFFYGGNLVGGVLGCLLAGFYLLRVHDMVTAGCVASAINATGALAAFLLAGWTRYEEPEPTRAEEDRQRAPGTWWVYLAIGLSGMAALGAEVIWTRLLSLLLGATVYTFSLILAVFLVGLGIGSGLGAMVARRYRWPALALGVCQWLLAPAVAWTAFTINRLPSWPIDPSGSPSPWIIFEIDLLRCLWAVIPPACLWGASFPLALASAATGKGDPGRVAAGVSAANTLGAIVGAVAFSLFLIPLLGTAHCERVVIALSVGAALVAIVPALTSMSNTPGWASRPIRPDELAGLAVLVVVAAGLAWWITPVPWMAVAYGRFAAKAASNEVLAPGITRESAIPRGPGKPTLYCTYVGEGRNVSVAVTQNRLGYRNFHGAGKVQASTLPKDMRLQRMLGHLPALVHKKPRSVLVVACGAGITAGTFLLHPDVERIVICDIEPLVPTQVTPLFGKENYHVVDGIAQQNPHTVNGKQVEVVYDDGRHFLRTTREKFDVITSDPIDPWVKGCAALNTVEYYQACRDHLNPGGSVSLWIPLYESDLATTKSFIGTFFSIFPDGILWSNERDGQAYDGVLFGQVEPTLIDVDDLQRRLDQPDHESVKESLREVGFGTTPIPRSRPPQTREPIIDLLATFAGHGRGLKSWSRTAQINTDRNLRLQYLAGLSFNASQGPLILNSILADYRFPEQIFVGSAKRLDALRDALRAAARGPGGTTPPRENASRGLIEIKP
jgi:spermidine synthase